jgi:hypothetical protein
MTDTDRLDWLTAQHAELWAYPVSNAESRPSGEWMFAARLGPLIRVGATPRQALDQLRGAVETGASTAEVTS